MQPTGYGKHGGTPSLDRAGGVGRATRLCTMTIAIYKTSASAAAALALITSLVACSGSSAGTEAGSSASASTSPTATATSSPAPPFVYVSLTPHEAATAKQRLEGTPGVSRTRYDTRIERFYVYFTPDVTSEQRSHVTDVIHGVLG